MVDNKKLTPEVDHATQIDPSKIAPARPDLNSPPTDNPHVPDMNQGTAKTPDTHKDTAKEDVAATSAGVLGGAAVGAAFGVAGGPPGALVGGIIGGVVGGIAGHDIAQPDQQHPEDEYWREHYQHANYYQSDRDLEYARDYAPAYRLGYDHHPQDEHQDFSAVETELEAKWQQFKGESRLSWQEAKLAAQDAWQRLRR